MSFESFREGVANDLVNELVKAAPFRTGTLINSISWRPSRNGFTLSFVDYAEFVEFGTPPHIIRPKNKKALAWGKNLGGGKREHVAAVVHHPGTRPNPFIRNTIRQKLKGIIAVNARRHLGGGV